VTARAILSALALTLLAAAPAAAAEVTLRVAPEAGVRLGNATGVSGMVTDGGAPLAGRTVRLESRGHPFTGRWKRRGEGRTGADGRFAFSIAFRRNHQVRARLVGAAPASPELPPERDTLSPLAHAYVLPAFTLSYTQRGTRAIRLRQVYTVPRSVRLSAPTRFYVGPCKPRRDRCTAERVPLRAQAETRRVRRGRYVARATVRIPAAYEGRFSYVSCFAYSDGSGMGNPDLRCPRRSVRLRP
jgi:hypothetical protein